MKLKPSIKGLNKVQMNNTPVQQERTPKKKSESRLPSDDYKPMFPPVRFLVRETPSNKDATKTVKQYLEISVKRFNDDEALPNVWVQMYQESDFYTGYLKGKTVYLPLEALYDFIDQLTEVSEECDKRKIEY